jgi:fumarylacetoacetate (FAA) hydrolase family protein
MHANIDAALKALHNAEDAYASAVSNLEGQYLRSLETSHDGDNAECQEIKAQIAAVRKKYLKGSVGAPSAESVKPRFEADASGDAPIAPVAPAAPSKSKKK